jgi:hypothetical protein
MHGDYPIADERLRAASHRLELDRRDLLAPPHQEAEQPADGSEGRPRGASSEDGRAEPRVDLLVQAIDSGGPLVALLGRLALLITELFGLRCDKILE